MKYTDYLTDYEAALELTLDEFFDHIKSKPDQVRIHLRNLINSEADTCSTFKIMNLVSCLIRSDGIRSDD